MIHVRCNVEFWERLETSRTSQRRPTLHLFLFWPKKLRLDRKKICLGNEKHTFWQMSEEELRDFVTQEAQSVSAHWCSELAGLSLWSPINGAARLLQPSPPKHAANSSTKKHSS